MTQPLSMPVSDHAQRTIRRVAEAIAEQHGSIHRLQCRAPCGESMLR